MTDPVFEPVRSQRAFDVIIGQIRAMLRSGELRPGDRLPSERALSEQFQVSRNTVREALRMLEISGLITLRKGATGGAFIAKPDPGVLANGLSDAIQLTAISLSDLTEARLWVESMIVRVACERMTEEHLQALHDNVEQAGKLSAQGDWERKAVVHIEFHNLLAQATGNPILSILMRSLTEVVREIGIAAGPATDDVTLRSRARLLGHLRRRDADQAVAEMEHHLRRLHEMWLTGAYEGSRTPR
ncbi:FadR/GntR family transcriptional regulator [Pseudonocardia eucalypti]|uniref:FadR/GntR family transcriptional regulator n=1 Tax=Pseudonocardia eucalypti TaxID=648755 RepID=A0ABP9PZH0_9PSEU|nr:DNA-binding FadR family transcriptional regulator [Pseudonocardia eucalypti]